MSYISDIDIRQKISNLLCAELLDCTNRDVYSHVDTAVNIEILNPVFRNYLSVKGNLKNVGIDLPMSFGTYSENSFNTMVVALDPKRNDTTNEACNKTPILMLINSIFSLHTDDGRQTRKNIYWNFISYLSKFGFVYVTDVYKIYFEYINSQGKHIISNKDRGYLATENENAIESTYNQNVKILQSEINIINPSRIITLGKDARKAVVKILSLQVNENDISYSSEGREYVFLPHISPTVTQNITTIANLYKGLGIITRNANVYKIGSDLSEAKSLEDIFVD